MRFLKAFWLGSTVGVGLLLCVVCCWRLVRTTPVARAKRWHVLVPVALVAIAEVAYAVLLSLQPAEDPERIDFASVFFARAEAVTALAVAVMWAVVRAHRTRWAVARLAEQLGDAPTPGSLKAALARSLGDGSLEVAYWLPGGSRYVDAAGHAMNPRPGRQQMATAIVRDGQQVALVVHDRGLRAAHDLEQEIGAAARLAVDNERLRAAVLAQLHGLRASRARIVETADATRRRLERNLHDGAQQRLLAVSYELRLASAAAGMDGKLSLAPLLTSAAGQAQKALAELRELAHGIFPAILTEAGLRTALSTLADHASVAVVLPELVDERYPPVVETAAYLVVAEAVGDAARRSATYLIARVFREGGNLVIEVNDDGELPSPTSLIHVADRVGAIGGHLDVGANRLRAEIPCG
jgi:signal transduction histidine kinase